MIILDSNYSLVCIMNADKTTTEMDFVVSFASSSTSAFTESIVTGVTNGDTEVEMVAAPAAGTTKVIKSIHVYNADTATKTLTIKVKTGATLRLIIKSDLAPGDTLIMSDRGEWSTFKNSYQEYGLLKLSADQTTGIANGNPVKFDTLVVGNIQTDLANYHVILRAGIIYLLQASIYSTHSGAGYICIQHYDLTNAGYIGIYTNQATSSNTGHIVSQNTLCHIVTPATSVDLEVAFLASSNLTSLESDCCWWLIKSLN